MLLTNATNIETVNFSVLQKEKIYKEGEKVCSELDTKVCKELDRR